MKNKSKKNKICIFRKILRALGKAFHPECFSCPSCQKSLDGIPFTVDKENQAFCLDCYHERFSPRCAACLKVIAPQGNETEVVGFLGFYEFFKLFLRLESLPWTVATTWTATSARIVASNWIPKLKAKAATRWNPIFSGLYFWGFSLNFYFFFQQKLQPETTEVTEIAAQHCGLLHTHKNVQKPFPHLKRSRVVAANVVDPRKDPMRFLWPILPLFLSDHSFPNGILLPTQQSCPCLTWDFRLHRLTTIKTISSPPPSYIPTFSTILLLLPQLIKI